MALIHLHYCVVRRVLGPYGLFVNRMSDRSKRQHYVDVSNPNANVYINLLISNIVSCACQ